MNGLSGIRNINNNNRPTRAARFQLQGYGDGYGVFDSHTGGVGLKSKDASAVSKEADRLNLRHDEEQASKALAARDNHVVAEANRIAS